jgi:ATP-dependent Zn protease
MYPDYDRAIAEGKQVEETPGARNDHFRIDNLSREYLTRGGFSTVFGPANVLECQKALGEYPQDLTGVRR